MADFLPRKNRACYSSREAKVPDNQIKVDAFHMVRTF